MFSPSTKSQRPEIIKKSEMQDRLLQSIAGLSGLAAPLPDYQQQPVTPQSGLRLHQPSKQRCLSPEGLQCTACPPGTAVSVRDPAVMPHVPRDWSDHIAKSFQQS